MYVSNSNIHLSVNVLRAAGRSDCSNGGISSTETSLDLFASVDAIPEGFPREKALVVVKRKVFGEVYVHAQPADRPFTPGTYMSGGNFIHTSDSRWSEITGVHYPIAVHDRREG